MKTKRLNEKISVCGQPSRDECQKLAEEGIASVVNLRCAGEEEQPLRPDEEGKVCEAAGLHYRHLPVDPKDLGEHQVDRFRALMDDLPAPVLVHCASGKRAGAFAMMHLAVEEGMNGEDVLEQAEEMGFECDSEDLKRFVTGYIDERTQSAA